MNEKELRQLQSGLKNTEGVTFARKAPKQLGLFVDFRGYQYRIDYIEEKGWEAKIAYVEGPDLAELQALVPVLLKCQQDKEAEAIAEVEAKKAEEEQAKADAEAKAKAEKAEIEELTKKCVDFHVSGWNRQEWCKQRFGKFAISDLTLAELRILWEKIRILNRAKEKAQESHPEIIAEADKAENLVDRLNRKGLNYQLSAKVISSDRIEIEYGGKVIRACRGNSAFLWQFEDPQISVSLAEDMIVDFLTRALQEIKQESLDRLLAAPTPGEEVEEDAIAKPICLGWKQAIADKPLAYYRYQGWYKVGDAEGYLEEFESAEEAIEYINNWPHETVLPAEAKTGKSLAIYQIAEEMHS